MSQKISSYHGVHDLLHRSMIIAQDNSTREGMLMPAPISPLHYIPQGGIAQL